MTHPDRSNGPRQPQQLAMFMPAHALRRLRSVDDAGWESRAVMWASKAEDNAKDGLTKHVGKHGVHIPVSLVFDKYDKRSGTDLAIMAGHHRIQAAYHTNPAGEVPVEYLSQTESWATKERPPVPGWEDKPRFRSYP